MTPTLLSMELYMLFNFIACGIFGVLQSLVRALGLTICKTMFLTVKLNTDIKHIWLINCLNVKSLHTFEI